MMARQQKLSKSFDWKSSPAKSPLREKPESVISLPDLGPRSPSKCKEPTTPIPLTELKSSILTSRSEERTSTPSTFLFNNKEIRNEELQKEQNVNEQLQKELATSHERTSKMRQEVKENEARIMRKRNELASLRQTVVLLAVVEATQKRLDDLKNEIEDMEDIYSECETLKSEVEDDEETKTLETTLQKTLMDQQTRIDRFMNDIPSLIYEINQRKPKQGN
ncbi:hypothetical protein DFQ28_006638 [Apophysomyces sp. BC1034]|nr:hypothetical protein DFQ30_004696 [Apophysomyces sp. BC1015]KAG0182534.1 hypothetical protein DFQ29_003536 [Apophysomyces sp. BC1021]KAG0193044.1 hypothetical protein DFQ28_006638 [Apophysomyces sp. BC1034]